MDQRIRLATAAAVMLIGLGFALLFRHPAGTDDPVPLQSDPLVLRRQPDLRGLAAGDSPSAAAQARPQATAPAEPSRPTPTIVTATDRPAPPPELPKTYPDSRGFSGLANTNFAKGGQMASTRWGASLGEMLPGPEGVPTSTPPTHKIIDGDSLALLAERDLGSASRAMEIFQANRNVLTEPDILPMGVELKIPRAEQTSQRP